MKNKVPISALKKFEIPNLIKIVGGVRDDDDIIDKKKLKSMMDRATRR